MSRPANIVIEGRAYRWRDILELRRQQIAAWKAARPDQPALFPLIEDCRSRSDRTAAGRYNEPSLLDCLRQIMEQSDASKRNLTPTNCLALSGFSASRFSEASTLHGGRARAVINPEILSFAGFPERSPPETNRILGDPGASPPGLSLSRPQET